MENTWENISLTAGAGTIFIIIYSQTQTLNSFKPCNQWQWEPQYECFYDLYL